MTTVRSSSSKFVASLSIALAVAAGARASAHRLDEYLQASRIGIDPTRITVELDLTPGQAVASRIVAEIDADRNGSISAVEARAYAASVLREISIDIDSHVLALTLVSSEASPVAALNKGEGTLRLLAAAETPATAVGDHRLRYRNTHHVDIGVYLANALAPWTDRVGIVSQERAADQHELVVHYVVRDRTAPAWLPVVLSVTVTLLVAAFIWKPLRSLVD